MNSTEKIICPLCNDAVDKLLYRFHIDDERSVLEKIKENNPLWHEKDGACSRCVDYYHVEIVCEQRILPEIGPHFQIKSADDFVILPTGLRLNAHPRYTGKGVTICFIDSGFYPHPDLVAHRNRIKKYVDINVPGKSFLNIPTDEKTAAAGWHGTMTSVVCAGDGYMSRGLYKGIAPDAELVLIKVQNEQGHIPTANIVRALEWVLRNHDEYNIRVVNMSVSTNEVCSYKESETDMLAEQLITKGITVVAAVGNDENGKILPPANALNVIAVGGIDDENVQDNGALKAYHSSYGETVDKLMKPELVANAIWIAAPILPGTREQTEAAVLYDLVIKQRGCLQDGLKNNLHLMQLEESILTASAEDQDRLIKERIQHAKFISPHYMHVDGTSFAAPIVCSLVAQMLEINPLLTPRDIRHILFSTSKRIESIAPDRQGYGYIKPRKAIINVLKKETIMKPENSPYINTGKNTIEFFIEHNCAEEISLAGSFNNWAQDVLLMEPGKNGIWKIEIPMLPGGRYQYKFLIDHHAWVEDFDNPFREPDGFNGFNSLLIVEN